MNVEAYRSWFLTGTLILMLLAATPILALFVHFPNNSERFSEIWLLGPEHKAEGYPFNVRANKTYSVYLGVANHLGYSAYYRVYVKLRNETQSLPVASNATPSSLPPLYEFNLVARDGEIWEAMLNFGAFDVSPNGVMTINNLSVNEAVFKVDSVSAWNTERNGFYWQLLFELWLYNLTSNSFQYHNRSVGIWLNVTN